MQRSAFRPFLGLLASAALFAACSDMPTQNDAVVDAKKSPLPPPPAPTTDTRPFYAGAYLGDAASTPENIGAGITAFAQRSGKRPSLVKTFHDLRCDWSSVGWCGRLARQVDAAGATNYLAVDLRWSGAPATGLLDAINAGQADATLTQMARDFRAFGRPVLLEPGWEMNGNWNYAWQGALNGGEAGGPARFVQAWRRMVDIFRREGATNIRWVWNPNVGNPVAYAAGTSHWNWYANYYPGATYVDYIGAHGFNAPRVWGGSWKSFGEMFDGTSAEHMLSDMAARFPGKPILVGEFATEEGTGTAKATWIKDAYAALKANPAVVGAVWFDANKEADWRIDSTTASLDAFRAAMSDARVQTAFVSTSVPAGQLAVR
ncbi:MAG TPA: glycosyl hydrolase [Longimicrobium sp.]|jgi:hypothetical protein|uniref:glycoside hydrolase family 26 protein n=1 Tax=Longimicrobium sp. TaxID=2029185 RepID=UPI002ED81A9A